MHTHLDYRLWLVPVLVLGLTAANCGSTLQRQDAQLQAGQTANHGSYNVGGGDWVLAYVSSPDFDTKVTVEMKGGGAYTNDDVAEGEQNKSMVLVQADAPDTATVTVSAYDDSAAGAYVVQHGVLTGGDTLFSGTGSLSNESEAADAIYEDAYTLTLRANDFVMIEATTDEIDIVLAAIVDNDEKRVDSHTTGTEQLQHFATRPGRFKFYVRGFDSDAVGAYTLKTTVYNANRVQETSRELLAGGGTDVSEFEVRESGNYLIRAMSENSDTVLRVINTTTGDGEENDDFMGTDAGVSMDLEAGAKLRIETRSYDGSAGSYKLLIDRMVEGDSPEAASGEMSLAQDDDVASVKFVNWHAYTAPGQGIVVARLNSDDFDGIIRIKTSSVEFENDDAFIDDTSTARLAAPVSSGEQIKIGVTTYETNSSGEYTLDVLFFPSRSNLDLFPHRAQ